MPLSPELAEICWATHRGSFCPRYGDDPRRTHCCLVGDKVECCLPSANATSGGHVNGYVYMNLKALDIHMLVLVGWCLSLLLIIMVVLIICICRGRCTCHRKPGPQQRTRAGNTASSHPAQEPGPSPDVTDRRRLLSVTNWLGTSDSARPSLTPSTDIEMYDC
ncbi:Hypp9053 [Branchiostoma lanceolatum]|uniref:Hypp9053 protein n=1 Tax=Branchiostoma lanceolatum TaxID=7740 RepID=A0A8J9ZBA0_BRALA|nr:Hypp9053 [Branchiostoma lanceolatum]